jgi:DNA-binding transcriptional ArsR family regulator
MIDEEFSSRRLLACLGDPSRFRLVVALRSGERCVSELALSVGLSQSCTTRHLQALQREGLVSGARSGKRVVFSLRMEEPGVEMLIAWALEAEPPTNQTLGPPRPRAGQAGASHRGRAAQDRRPGATREGVRPSGSSIPKSIPESRLPDPAQTDRGDETIPGLPSSVARTPEDTEPDPPHRRRADIEDYLL